MRQRIIAISTALLGLAAGTIAFFNWETGEIVKLYDQDWEFIDREKCDLNPCVLPACVTAQNHINDAGLPCVIRLASCEMRINPRIRAAAVINGVTLGPQKYQTLRFGVERCNVPPRCIGDAIPDGGCLGFMTPAGSTFGIAVDDSGWPMLASVAQVTPPCVRAPLDGGINCLRDGRFIGTGNVFPSSRASGTQCEPVECSIIFGDDPDRDL